MLEASRFDDISKAAVAEAEVEAAGCSSAHVAFQGLHSKFAAGSAGNCPADGACVLPTKGDCNSPGTHESKVLAAQSLDHMLREGPTDAPMTPQAAPAKASIPLCDSPIAGAAGNGESATIGKRKQARKSTRNAAQSTASVQQSNAGEPQAGDSDADVKPIILDSSTGSGRAKPTPDEVIDLT